MRNLTSPLLLIQGDADEEVDFQETVGLVRALRNLGRAGGRGRGRGRRDGDRDGSGRGGGGSSDGQQESVVEVRVFPDEAHGLAAYGHQLEGYLASAAFFGRYLLA